MENVAKEIQEHINTLNQARALLKARAEAKANTIGVYRKKLAVTLIQLKNGVEFTLEGNKVVNPSATTSLSIAHGICFQEKIDMEKAEALYKNAIVTLEAIKVIINAYQSINKYQSEV